jgi:hypothetical protein
MAILNNSNAISSGAPAYDINNSLRIRGIDASAYLNRTPAGAGNRRTWTYSAWIKRGNITPAAGGQSIFYAGSSTSTPRGGIVFGNSGTDNKLSFNGMLYNTTTQVLGLETSAEFRDPSAWYHIVVVLDTTQATSSDRAKIYVNGSQVTAFGTATYPSLNQELQYNDAILHATRHPSGDYEYDGYLAEVNFIDGQALTPSSFGETDTTTGSWKPKAYTGTYGTNGFYLKFSDIATTSGSNAGLGKDFSGNANYWTTNNISVTAGTTYDAMIDSPTLTSATVANYCVLNPLQYQVVVPSQGNLYVAGGNDYTFERGTFWVSTGKWYFEWVSVDSNLPAYVGVAADNITSWSGVTTSGISWYGHSNAYYKNFTGTSLVAASAISIGDIIGVAFDCDAGTVSYYKNNSLVHTDTTLTPNALVSPVLMETFSGGSWSSAAFNFGQRPFVYTPPTGFVRLNTYNLPTPTILQGNKYMDATTYSAASPTNRVIVNQAQFRPDLVWIKSRSQAYSHYLFDSNRGTSAGALSSNNTSVQNWDTGTQLSSFNSNGYTISSGDAISDTSAVAWQWQAGQGSNTTNTQGSITSTVSVNATAGFSVATFTGTGANATIGHGLGVAPRMFIVKTRSGAADWVVYHASVGNTAGLYLNQTAASTTSSAFFNNTSPTSSVFTLGSGVVGNGVTAVAYCWAEIAGFSKFGSYTGNNSTDGVFVYTGFRPKYVLIKNYTSAGNNWAVYDGARNTYNVEDAYLRPNTSGAESTYAGLDFVSNGFKLRNTDSSINDTSSYIYMAFAENPFKNSNAR